jgi:pimeloyl-ACP methyl ester carboxylesterase
VVRDGIELAYVREGVGGVPLLLCHGWPGSKRLWWRNIQPLADAGFEVIVPDQRGFNESPVPEDPAQWPDAVATAYDFKALLDLLGHDKVVLVGGDFGCGIVQDMSLRFPGLVLRQVCFNGTSPVLPELYTASPATSSRRSRRSPTTWSSTGSTPTRSPPS